MDILNLQEYLAFFFLLLLLQSSQLAGVRNMNGLLSKHCLSCGCVQVRVFIRSMEMLSVIRVTHLAQTRVCDSQRWLRDTLHASHSLQFSQISPCR